MKIARPVYAVACYQSEDGSSCSAGPRPCYASTWKELVGCLV